jgi:hypothetical protein
LVVAEAEAVEPSPQMDKMLEVVAVVLVVMSQQLDKQLAPLLSQYQSVLVVVEAAVLNILHNQEAIQWLHSLVEL